MNQNISIIIINWNGWRDTIECLESLYQIDYNYQYNIVLVDNNSTDNSLSKIKEYLNGKLEVTSSFFNYNPHNKPLKFKEYSLKDLKTEKNPEKLTIIKNDQNSGFAKGNNIGIKYAIDFLKSDYVLLLNNDTVVKKNFLAELVKSAELNDTFGLFSPLIYEYFNENELQYSADKIKWFSGRIVKRDAENCNSNILISDTICGASMLIKKETINKIGYLPEDYFMLWEDLDYSQNAIKNNFKCAYVPKSKIWHKGSVSIGKISSPLRVKYSLRNRIIFWKKYSSNLQFFCSFITFLFYHAPLILMIGLLKTEKKITFLQSFYKGFSEGISIVLIHH
ncbi:Glycosyl transferase family 2 [anaerobic digester metagenome]